MTADDVRAIADEQIAAWEKRSAEKLRESLGQLRLELGRDGARVLESNKFDLKLDDGIADRLDDAESLPRVDASDQVLAHPAADRQPVRQVIEVELVIHVRTVDANASDGAR